MKQFFAFVRKEFYHIFRDRRTMLILLGMPVVQIILFGFAISTEVKNVRVVVLDPSNDVMTRRIVDRIGASEYFRMERMIHSPEELETIFREGDADLAIVFSTRFADGIYTGDSQIQLVADATDPNMATTRTNYAAGIIVSVQQEMLPPGMSVATIVPDVKLLYNPQMKSTYNFVPGVMGLILMLICAMMTSISIVRDGDFVGLSGKTTFRYFVKGGTLFCAVVHQPGHYSVIVSLCTACTGSRQPVLADNGVFVIYIRVVGIRATYLFCNTNTGGGYACFGVDTDDADNDSFRYDFSYREHAVGIADYF